MSIKRKITLISGPTPGPKLKQIPMLIFGFAIFMGFIRPMIHPDVYASTTPNDPKPTNTISNDQLPNPQATITAQSSPSTKPQSIYNKFSASYFSFWDVPSLDGFKPYPPNERGLPLESGLSLTNLVSIKFAVSERIALDVQNRFQVIHTVEPAMRIQSPRVGVSGVLLAGKDWKFSGAINTDLPKVGYITTQRKILFNPGLFANFSYQPPKSR